MITYSITVLVDLNSSLHWRMGESLRVLDLDRRLASLSNERRYRYTPVQIFSNTMLGYLSHVGRAVVDYTKRQQKALYGNECTIGTNGIP